jgi:hypothetical protein
MLQGRYIGEKQLKNLVISDAKAAKGRDGAAKRALKKFT